MLLSCQWYLARKTWSFCALLHFCLKANREIDWESAFPFIDILQQKSFDGCLSSFHGNRFLWLVGWALDYCHYSMVLFKFGCLVEGSSYSQSIRQQAHFWISSDSLNYQGTKQTSCLIYAIYQSFVNDDWNCHDLFLSFSNLITWNSDDCYSLNF